MLTCCTRQDRRRGSMLRARSEQGCQQTLIYPCIMTKVWYDPSIFWIWFINILEKNFHPIKQRLIMKIVLTSGLLFGPPAKKRKWVTVGFSRTCLEITNRNSLDLSLQSITMSPYLKAQLHPKPSDSISLDGQNIQNVQPYAQLDSTEAETTISLSKLKFWLTMVEKNLTEENITSL